MNENAEIIREAKDILNGLCEELDMAKIASDPYPPDSDYEDFILGLAHGLMWENYDGWVFREPSIDKARLIIASYNETDA